MARQGLDEEKLKKSQRQYELETVDKFLNPPVKLDPEIVPPVPRHYDPDPPVAGDQGFSKTAQKFLAQYPGLRKAISRIVQGPTSGSQGVMMHSGLRPEEFQGTNLMGVYNTKDKSIGINPALPPGRLEEILYHESAHAQGADERDARDVARRSKPRHGIRTDPSWRR